MEQAQNTRSQAPTQGVAPLKVFIALLVLLGVTLLAWYLTRPDEVVSTSGRASDSRQPSTLTEAEAIQEFERLHDLYVRSYAERDPSLIGLYAAPGSAMADSSEIARLLREGVVDKTRWGRRSIHVVSLTRNQFVISEVVEVHPRFVDEETGEDLTFGRPRLETVMWTVTLYPQGWRLASAEVELVERLEMSR